MRFEQVVEGLRQGAGYGRLDDNGRVTTTIANTPSGLICRVSNQLEMVDAIPLDDLLSERWVMLHDHEGRSVGVGAL